MNRALQNRDRQGAEGGFALLIVFLLAAAVALMLYQQMPRVAFESERDKEQLLIDRGEQYKRAIQLYYVAFKRYPARIEDLENTNDKRFLRRRYVDPYTGKDEWRLIHTNGMYLTDSLVQKPPANPANGPGSTQTNAANASPAGTPPAPVNPANPTDPNAPPQVNAAVAARPSDRPLVQNASFTGNTPPGGSGQPGVNPADPNYSNPASFPPLTLFPNGYNASSQPGQPGQPRPGQPGVGQPGFPQTGQPQNGLPQQPGFPQGGFPQTGFPQTGLPQTGLPQPGLVPPGAVQPGGIQPALFQGALPQPPGAQAGVVPPYPNGLPPGQQSPFPPLPGQPNQLPALNPNFANQSPQQPVPPQYTIGPGGQFVPNPAGQQQQPQGQPAFPNPAGPTQPGAAPNQALNLINQLLTTPRQPPPGVGASTNQTVGGGIAGVASTYTGPTIKSYGDRSQFQEWEFVFQLQQQGLPGQPGAPGQQGAPGQPGQPATPGQSTTPGQPAAPGQPGLPGLPGLPAMPFGSGPGTPQTRP